MSKLYSRAKTKLDTAKFSWDKRHVDDAYVDSTCFDLQQCIEFLLKYLVELSGERYKRTHDLNEALNILSRCGVRDTVLDSIGNKSLIYNEWEANSRYLDDFVALSKDVEDAFKICEDLFNYVDHFSPKDPTDEMLSYAKSRGVSLSDVVSEICTEIPDTKGVGSLTNAKSHWEEYKQLKNITIE